MTETTEHHPRLNYLAVFYVLVAATIVSFWTVSFLWPLGHGEAGSRVGHTLVMIVAVVKAVLVATYFMHLKFDWFKVYFMVIPALVLGAGLMCALLPDIALADTRILLP